jgi:hypothetical protein
MSGAMREKDAADFDLERFTEMFDRAMTSSDPRVKNALRQLMMMVILTDEGDHEAKQRASHGPIRRLQEEMREQFRWIKRLEDQVQSLKNQLSYNEMSKAQGGYRAQDYNLKYGDTTSGQMVDPKEYWNSVIAQKSTSAEIPASALQGLNIKVAADTGEK